MRQGPPTTFFSGTLLDPEDFRLEQSHLRGESRPVELEIGENGQVQPWTEVADLRASRPHDRHFVLDRESGRVRFGDGEHGRRPEAGSRVRASYRGGGGGRSRAVLVAIPLAAGLAGFVAAFLRRRDP